jgi:hypothetical protein
MLVGMDIPAAAGPWIALGVVLGIVLLGLAGLGAVLLARRSATRTPVRQEPSDDVADDLATFLEHPPGSPGERRGPETGWAALSAPPPAPAAPAAPGARGVPGARRSLVVVAVAAVLLAGGAAAVAAGSRDDDPATGPSARGSTTPERTSRPPAEDIEARLSFGGVVLERHAVGITATYPELRLTGGRAQLELPTYNCLAGEAPPDPVAAGCRRTASEYAELAAPDLRVTRTGEGLEITGRFPTETRPNGSGPVPTGRTYEFVITVAAGDRARHGWLPAEGTLHLGRDEAATTGTDAAAGVNVLRYGDR